MLPNNKYLVRKISTNKTQVIHRMRMCQLTPREPPADIRILTQEWKPDPEVSLKHDDLYARAWECEYEQPIFDTQNNTALPPNSPDVPVQSDLLPEEMRNTPRTAHECFPGFLPQPEELCDVTDTYPDMEPDVKTSSEQLNNSPTNHPPPPVLNTIYVITRNLLAMTTTDTNL